ncbi:MAG: sensor histidine kinase [Xanthomonadales bacterium]|nr:sensor histidine kinase [Xanthomonadales bacterium]NIN60095.1 sensor histidine kinase [Xanthomonadales bacterium]NIN75465.1 sensor histidine kinase [Xanthomonadales bacterium]NIO13561.1 sensor histidine kinase [Xanthomonadales bacterium]NIP12488.1 sensor histidine kinase [Xanthomonadales bacterium]
MTGVNRLAAPAGPGVYPPTFCDWRLLLAVVAVAQLSVLLIGLGRGALLDWRWLGATSAYGVCLAVLCAVWICVTRAWLRRLSARAAWLTSWSIMVLMAVAFSYGAAVVGTVLGVGPGPAGLTDFMLLSVVPVALVGMAFLRYLFVRAQWQAQLTAQADARVAALQAWIRPHFLFNSLNTIASLVAEDPEGAERATEDLADLFRGSMRRADRMIPLREELQLARKFLDMERRRLGERLQVDWEAGELPPAAPVLPLLLQPLLENAVMHGIQRRAEGGRVRVYGRAESDNIVITISNPLPAAAGAIPAAEAGHGMALGNIRKRLELAYGGRASLVTEENEERFFAVLTLPHAQNSDR